jgi:SAM-dependent methyltransferase
LSPERRDPVDLLAHNRKAWNSQALGGSEWSRPVDAAAVAKARAARAAGRAPDVVLTPTHRVPDAWFGDLTGARVLCLASGGGQQAPLLAAAGAQVVSYDLSDEQLARDAQVAEREGLDVTCVRGDMRDLSVFTGERFDLVFNPVSNVFVDDVQTVWNECARVLVPGGRLLAGFMNPDVFAFDDAVLEGRSIEGASMLRYRVPYVEVRDSDAAALARRIKKCEPLEFGHDLETQIGGQLRAGFALEDLFSDFWEAGSSILAQHMPAAFATLSRKRG